MMDHNSIGILNLVNGLVVQVDLNNRCIRASYISGNPFCKDITVDEFILRIIEEYQLDLGDSSLDDLITWSYSTVEIGTISFVVKNRTGEDRHVKVTKNIDDKKEHAFLLFETIHNEHLYSLLDPMTGLYQKESFKNLVNEAILNADSRPFSLLVVDIDDFKQLNDSKGHMFGDFIIKEIASYLKQYFKNGYVARYGGDEYAVLSFGSVDYDDVWEKLHNVCKFIEVSRKTNADFKNVSITLGCARYGVDGTTYEELFMKADKALYRGKAKGKNCFIIYKHELHKNINIGNSSENRPYLNNPEIEYQIFIDLFVIFSKEYDLETTIDKALNIIGSFFGVDRALFYKNENGKYLLASTYVNKIKPSNNEGIDKLLLPKENWKQHFVENYAQMNQVDNIKDLNPILFEYLNKQNIVSVFLSELRVKKIFGYLRLDMCNDKRRWTFREIYLIRAVTKFLLSYVSKKVSLS